MPLVNTSLKKTTGVVAVFLIDVFQMILHVLELCSVFPAPWYWVFDVLVIACRFAAL